MPNSPTVSRSPRGSGFACISLLVWVGNRHQHDRFGAECKPFGEVGNLFLFAHHPFGLVPQRIEAGNWWEDGWPLFGSFAIQARLEPLGATIKVHLRPFTHAPVASASRILPASARCAGRPLVCGTGQSGRSSACTSR